MKIRLAGLQVDSIVDGPGVRLAIYLQGCSHRCPGCHNPETHNPLGGDEISLDRLLDLIDNYCRGLDGVTISGGEPFEQAAPAAALAAEVVRRGLNLVLYSGYTFEELLTKSRNDRSIRRLLEAGWLLVDGPFISAEEDITLPYRGSRNQRIIDLSRSLAAGRPAEWACAWSVKGAS